MALRGTFHFLKIVSAPSIGKSGIKLIKKEKKTLLLKNIRRFSIHKIFGAISLGHINFLSSFLVVKAPPLTWVFARRPDS